MGKGLLEKTDFWPIVGLLNFRERISKKSLEGLREALEGEHNNETLEKMNEALKNPYAETALLTVVNGVYLAGLAGIVYGVGHLINN